jgi:hypothetical protein
VTVAADASLFDGRYGLGARKPGQLVPMTPFLEDDLDPAISDCGPLIRLSAGTRRVRSVSNPLSPCHFSWSACQKQQENNKMKGDACLKSNAGPVGCLPVY